MERPAPGKNQGNVLLELVVTTHVDEIRTNCLIQTASHSLTRVVRYSFPLTVNREHIYFL